MSSEEEHTEHGVHYVEGLVAVAREEAEQAMGITGGSLAGADELAELLGVGGEMGARLTAAIGLVLVDDPIDSSNQLLESGVDASPIHGLGFQWHTAYSPLPPRPAPGVVFPRVAPGRRDRVMAVVDTGIVENAQLPNWVRLSVIRDAEDVEATPAKGDASHGTFITGLIRQIAPNHMVSMAKADVYRDTALRPADPRHKPEPFPTTELHVSDGILRLIDRHRGDDSIAALTMSVGGPSWKPGTRSAMRALGLAIDLWRQNFPRSAIFAAAGNTDDPAPVYPAAFWEVRGVAAAANRNGPIVWDPNGSETPAPPRWWVDDVAPGSGLHGLSGVGRTEVVEWSGSSFATSIATAVYANNGPSQVRDGVGWWPGFDMDYGRIPGLQP